MSDHPHPMPGWVALAPIPDPEPPTEPPNPMAMLFGLESVRIVRAIVVEVGDGAGVPYDKGDTVYILSSNGTMIGNTLFMVGQNVIAWAPSDG